MKLVAPSTIITALELEELILVTELSEVNSCWLQLKLFWHACFFFGDYAWDLALCIVYFSRGEVWEAIAIIVLLFMAGGVTSLYYWWNEKWIDIDHDQSVRSPHESQGDVAQTELLCAAKPQSQSEPDNEQLNSIEMTEFGNDSPIASSSHSTPPVQVEMSTSSKSNEVNSFIGQSNLKYKRARCCSQWFGISPIFRAYYLINVLLDKHFEVVRRQRLGRQGLSEEELKSLGVIHESQIVQACFSMIETSFEALPQTLLQIYLAAVSVKLAFKPNDTGDYLIYLSIIWCLISAAISLTTYQGAYYLLYVKLARIKDKLYLGGDIPPKVLTPAKWSTTFATFFFHLAILVGRVYGFANILVTYGLLAFLVFIALLFLTQYYWLESAGQRMVFENPTRGITTACSNLVDRFTNLFSFHQIRPTLKSLGIYHIIFLFWVLLFSKMEYFIHPKNSYSNNTSCRRNESNMESNSSLSINGTLAISNNSDNENSQGLSLCEVVANDLIVVITWGVSFAVSLIYLLIRTKVDKILREKYFPILKALELWGELTGTRMTGFDVKDKRALCLFIMGTDDELAKVLDDKCPCCFRGSDEDRVDTKAFRDAWEKLTQQYNFKELLRINSVEGKADERKIVQDGWERLKGVKQGNAAALGVKSNYVLSLNEMIDPLFDDSGIEVKDLYPFLHFYDNFEEYLSKLNSFRLGRMFDLLGKDGENRSTLKCIWQR